MQTNSVEEKIRKKEAVEEEKVTYTKHCTWLVVDKIEAKDKIISSI